MSEPEDFAVSRVYGIPFHDVWEAALSTAREIRGWSVGESDPRSGQATLVTLDHLGYRPLPAEVRLWLDEFGQTRLEIRLRELRRPLLPPSSPVRARRYLRALDRRLGLARSP